MQVDSERGGSEGKTSRSEGERWSVLPWFISPVRLGDLATLNSHNIYYLNPLSFLILHHTQNVCPRYAHSSMPLCSTKLELTIWFCLGQEQISKEEIKVSITPWPLSQVASDTNIFYRLVRSRPARPSRWLLPVVSSSTCVSQVSGPQSLEEADNPKRVRRFQWIEN